MHDQNVRHVGEKRSLEHVYLLVAALTLVLLNRLALDLLGKAVGDPGAVLDLQGKGVELLQPILDFTTRLADKLGAHVALESVLEEESLGRWLE